MIITAFNMAFRSILRNWRQSFTALASIAASFVSLTLFQGYMDDVQKMYLDTNIEREMMGHLIIENEDPKKNINPEEESKILFYLNKSQNVSAAVRFLPLTGTISNGASSMVFVGMGSDAKEGIKMRSPTWEWNAIAGSPLPENGDGLLIGNKLSKILGCNPAEVVGFKKGIGGYTSEIRPMNCAIQDFQLSVVTVNAQANSIYLPLTGITDAIYKELDERYVSVPLSTAQTLMDTKEIGYIAVKVKDLNSIQSFVDETNTFLKSQNLPIKALLWQNHRLGDLYNRTMDLLTLFRNFVVSVILVISSLGVFNTLLRNISERSREIGTLRSIGFTPMQVRGIFGIEASLLASFGCFFGIVLSITLENTINFLELTYKPGIFSTPVPFNIDVNSLILFKTAFFLISLVIFTALISLKRPLKQKISDCLTHV